MAIKNGDFGGWESLISSSDGLAWDVKDVRSKIICPEFNF